MAKIIGILIFCFSIVIIGIIGFNQLHYWERSVRIFKLNSEQSFGRNSDRRRGEFERREEHERPDRGRSIEGGRRHRGGHSRGGNSVQLGTVSWFLSVFAAFTVVTIYLDKVLYMIRKRKKRIA